MRKTVIALALIGGFSVNSLSAFNHQTEQMALEQPTFLATTISPLCMAVVKGDIDEVNRLVNNGIDVNKKSNGMMPIHYAAKYNRVEIIKVLITAGSEIHKPCDKGLTALTYAEKSDASDAAQFLKRFK